MHGVRKVGKCWARNPKIESNTAEVLASLCKKLIIKNRAIQISSILVRCQLNTVQYKSPKYWCISIFTGASAFANLMAFKRVWRPSKNVFACCTNTAFPSSSSFCTSVLLTWSMMTVRRLVVDVTTTWPHCGQTIYNTVTTTDSSVKWQAWFKTIEEPL